MRYVWLFSCLLVVLTALIGWTVEFDGDIKEWSAALVKELGHRMYHVLVFVALHYSISTQRHYTTPAKRTYHQYMLSLLTCCAEQHADDFGKNFTGDMYMHYITALIEQQMRDDMVKEAFNETLTAKKIVFQPQTANPGDYHVFQVLLTLTIAHSLISYAILLILTAYRYSSLRTARLLLDAILPSLVTMLAN